MEEITSTTQNLVITDSSDTLTTAQVVASIAMLQECAMLSDRFAKQLLTRLEADGILVSSNPQRAVIRKHALDAFGDLKREMLEALRQIIS